MGLKLKFGKVSRPVEPGTPVYVGPFSSKLKRVTMRDLIEVARRDYPLLDGNLTMGVVICYEVNDAEKLYPYFDCIEGIIRSRTARLLERYLFEKYATDALKSLGDNIMETIGLNGPGGLENFSIKVDWLEFKDITIAKKSS